MSILGDYSRTTLRSAVTENLRTAIDEGTLEPGAHLGEVDLSQRLGVSRATLREALRQLQQEGILSQDSRGRVSVRAIDETQLRDLFEVRTALEQLALRRLCAEDDRTVAVAELRAVLAHMGASTSASEGIRADLTFHATICSLTGNEALLRSWHNLAGLIRMSMSSVGIDPTRAEQTIERHTPIVDALERGDADAASAHLAQHMSDALDYIIDSRFR